MLESDIFRALGDPTRRAVYERLTGGERSVTELRAGLPISQPAVSQHLAALKAAGLVGERRDGRKVFYRIEPFPSSGPSGHLLPQGEKEA